jgi:L-threonylcarbamoyladenylate synthase
MIVIKLTAKNTQKVIDLAVAELMAGKIIVYPTETFYGLGCIVGNKKAVRKIYQIKGRIKNKALPFLLADMRMAGKYLKLNQTAQRLAKKYWPGPLSLVLPTTAFGRRALGSADAGARISSSKFATELVRAFGQPLVSTSANPSSQPSASSADAVIEYFSLRRYKPDLVIDAGRLPKSKGSTFVRISGSEIEIIRSGDINLKSKI